MINNILMVILVIYHFGAKTAKMIGNKFTKRIFLILVGVTSDIFVFYVWFGI